MSLALTDVPAVATTASRRFDHVLVTALLDNATDLIHFKDQEGRFIAVSRSKMFRHGVRHRIEIVGNVLNSLNVSASVVVTGMRQAKTEALERISELLQEHATDLGHYLT